MEKKGLEGNSRPWRKRATKRYRGDHASGDGDGGSLPKMGLEMGERRRIADNIFSTCCRGWWMSVS